MSKKVTLTCECGKTFSLYPSQIKRVKSGNIRCSKTCSPRIVQRECNRCGKLFTSGRTRNQKTCSKKCPGYYKSCKCEVCGVTFSVHKSRPSPRFCNDDCRKKWFSSAFTGNNSPHWQGGVNPNYYSAKRRAKMREGDAISHLEVFELANWICGICKEPIDKALRFPDKMAATLEHVIPLSKGGTHTWDNVDAAHAICNFRKSNKLPSESTLSET